MPTIAVSLLVLDTGRFVFLRHLRDPSKRMFLSSPGIAFLATSTAVGCHKRTPQGRQHQGQWRWQTTVCDGIESGSGGGSGRACSLYCLNPNQRGNEIHGDRVRDSYYYRTDDTEESNGFDRRSFLWTALSVRPMVLGVSSSVLSVTPAAAGVNAARKSQNDSESGSGLSDESLQSMVYERILGSGSYKTVYLVSVRTPLPRDGTHGNDSVIDADCENGNNNDDDDDEVGSVCTVRYYALAVERLRNKRDVKNAFRGVRIPELLQKELDATNHDGELFERIVDWWIQSSNVPEFVRGGKIFPGNDNGGGAAATSRTRSEPRKNFVGSRWMLSFKPVYETDLKRFIRNTPVLYPVGDDGRGGSLDTKTDKSGPRNNDGNNTLATSLSSYNYSDYWTEPVLMAFVLETLHAGKLMHEAGIVHRDIKPKNMMISTARGVASSPSGTAGIVRRPVIIDYGYSEIGSPVALDGASTTATPRSSNKAESKQRDVCVVHPGQLKGEVDYVLAEDLANYRGCQRGDAYAMGKTLYEFVFGSVAMQEHHRHPQNEEGEQETTVISVDGAEIQNREFRKLLFDDAVAGTESRFRLSREAAGCLLSVVRGLCYGGGGSGGSDSITSTQQGENALSFAEAEEFLSDFLSKSPSR
mmetsp:Transcript_113860/g.232955  ORF Transcript_113860/g.232955 Transcript_113860/m.232955 type:complete len:642 (+) Transcript_113860:134-2059(+)